jgi:hypothetical protein
MRALAIGGSIRLAAVAVALLLVGWLVISDQPPPAVRRPAAAPAGGQGSATVQQAWPNARIVDAPIALADGARYSPQLYVDAFTSIGVAPTPDGSAQRVVARSADGVRELRRIGKDHYPNFLGFTSVGDTVFWAESTLTGDNQDEMRLWRASLRGSAPAVELTADTGDMVFFESQYDLVVHGDRLYWVAAAPSEELVTDMRSVPVTGGKVTSRLVTGAYRLSAWPWLQSAAGSGQQGPLELRNLDTGQRITIPKSPAEYVACSPIWCRSIVTTGSDGGTRYDVTRPDGSARRRVGGTDVSAAAGDVGLLDRFELVMQTIGTAPADTYNRLALYDLTTGRLITVADHVGEVQAGQHMLWWSTGDQQLGTWHSLDLASLTP